MKQREASPRHRPYGPKISVLGPVMVALGLLSSCTPKPPIEWGPASAQVAQACAEAHLKANTVAQERALHAARADALQGASDGLHNAAQVSLEAANAVPPKPPGRVVLLGDSMAWAIAVELEPLMKADGHPFAFEYKVSDSVRAWKSSKAKPLRELLRKHDDADVVIIVLGSNDYFFPRVETLRSTLEMTNTVIGDGRACYWVGPPMWREDKGIVQFLANNLAPCAFFNSSELTLERRSDGIHPNRDGARAWAKAVYAWIKANPKRAHAPTETYHP
ncbi:MAG: hypothetical protein AAFX99_02620 [Myxococcota bacterium]